MSNDDKILENDIQYMLRGCDPHDAEARRHIARCIIAYVREHDGRDAERWRFWCAHSYLFGVLLPFRGPDDMNAQIDAAIARGKHGRV